MLASSSRSASLLLAGLVALVFAFAPSTAQAQISSDRPGLGDGPTVIAPGTFQAELGYQLSRTSEEVSVIGDFGQVNADVTVTGHDLGQLLLRYGLTDVLEVRAGIGSYGIRNASVEASGGAGSVSVDSEDGSGYLGTTLGTKVRLAQTSTLTLSGVANTSIPTGTGDFDAPDDRARQELKLALDGALGSGGLSLTVNAGASFFWAAGAQDDRAVEWLFIPTLNIPFNEKVGSYVGYGGFYSDGPNTNFVEAGLTLLATPDTQLDVNGGFRVDDNVDSQFFLGVGLAQRF